MHARSLVPAACALVLVMAPAALLAQGLHGGSSVQRMVTRFAEPLELTDEQQSRIDAIVSAAPLDGLREQLRDLREAFHAEHEFGTFDEVAARAFATTEAGLQSGLMVESLRLDSQVYSVLTEEQRLKLDELKGGRRGRHRAWADGGRRTGGE